VGVVERALYQLAEMKTPESAARGRRRGAMDEEERSDVLSGLAV
jgi:hypothetical protein